MSARLRSFGENKGRSYASLIINVSSVERADSFKYHGVHITEYWTWALHNDSVVRKVTVSPQMLEEIPDILSDIEEFVSVILTSGHQLYTKTHPTVLG